MALSFWGFATSCATYHASVSDIAIWTVSFGGTSLLLNTFSFLAFHRNHSIHGKLAKAFSWTLDSFARHNKWSKFVKIASLGKNPGMEGIGDLSHTRTAAGDSNSKWLTVSEAAPHRGHALSKPQCLSTRLWRVGKIPEMALQRKCLIFVDVLRDHTLCFRAFVLGSIEHLFESHIFFKLSREHITCLRFNYTKFICRYNFVILLYFNTILLPSLF